MEQQVQKIRMPDRTQRLYTVQDYRLALERANGNVRKAAEQEEARGCGFGFFYMNMVHKELETGRAWNFSEFFGQLYRNGSAEGTRKRADIINKDVDILRRVLTLCLNAYIRQKKEIDIWPTPGIQDVVQIGSVIMEEGRRKDLPPFDFLAPGFYVCEEDGYLRLRREPVFRRPDYRSAIPRTKEHEKLDEKRERLECVRKYTKGERRWNNFWVCIASIPMLIAVYWVLILIAQHFLGLDGRAVLDAFNAVGSENNIITYLIVVPYFLTMFPVTFYPLFALHPAVFWVGVVAVLIAGWRVVDMINPPKWISKRKYRKGVAAKRELEALVSSEEYQQIQRDYERAQREDEELARIWQEEWLAVCREKYDRMK